jgi:hypothetical protein
MGNWGLFPQGQSGRGMMMTTYLHLVQRLRMVELYFHCPYTFTAWRLIKPMDNFNFTLLYFTLLYFTLPYLMYLDK